MGGNYNWFSNLWGFIKGYLNEVDMENEGYRNKIYQEWKFYIDKYYEIFSKNLRKNIQMVWNLRKNLFLFQLKDFTKMEKELYRRFEVIIASVSMNFQFLIYQ